MKVGTRHLFSYLWPQRLCNESNLNGTYFGYIWGGGQKWPPKKLTYDKYDLNNNINDKQKPKQRRPVDSIWKRTTRTSRRIWELEGVSCFRRKEVSNDLNPPKISSPDVLSRFFSKSISADLHNFCFLWLHALHFRNLSNCCKHEYDPDNFISFLI